jgi:hypothetical protein
VFCDHTQRESIYSTTAAARQSRRSCRESARPAR